MKKRCSKCGRNRTVNNKTFQWAKRSDRKHGSWVQPCKDCKSVAHRARYAKNPEKYREHTRRWIRNNIRYNRDRQRERTQMLRMMCLTHYARDGEIMCECCGESELDFMTLDHPRNDGAKHRDKLGMSGPMFYRWLIKHKFSKKLRILCFNCNISRSMRGSCPHDRAKTPNALVFRDHIERPDSRPLENGVLSSDHL